MKSKPLVTKKVEATYTIQGKRYTFRYCPHLFHKFWESTTMGWALINRPLFQRIILKYVEEFDSEH